jgi:dihydrofolate synthase / folylpolyglutamate synthase
MQPDSTYQAHINWLFSRFPSFQNLGATAYKPGLERVHQLLDALNIDAHSIPSIHIAGTNGKGSTAAYCSSLLIEQGFKVGLFTSPHIYDFSERIRVNGVPISEVAVIDFCQHFQQLNSTIDASFFELTFAMALAHFQAENCDYIVIETGLGGRLDATNVLIPKVSVITNIALDHQDLLGDTIEKIALEKAGIIKKQTPVVIGEKSKTTKGIFQGKSLELMAPIYFSEELELELSNLPLIGYQRNNFNTALFALQKIGFTFSSERQLSALSNLRKNTGFFGRLDVFQLEPKIIIDVSHNPAGITATLPLIQNECAGQLYILYGAAKDKDASEILALFPSQAKVAACIFNNPRSKNLQEWQALGVHTVYDNLQLAIEVIKKQMQPTDLLWITGSFFLISDLPTEKKIF